MARKRNCSRTRTAPRCPVVTHMAPPPCSRSRHNLRFVFIGLSITSSWGNGHATTYRGLLSALARRGHTVTFLERDVPWYACHRDSTRFAGFTVCLYDSLAMLQRAFADHVRMADVVVVGSYVPDGQAVQRWVRATARGLVAFYDIDTPVTLAALEADRCEYLSRRQLAHCELYLSFTGGPALRRLERLGVRVVRPLYCSVDPAQHHPVSRAPLWDLGYLGTYCSDRQPALDALMLRLARRWPDAGFVVAGPLYPESVEWPPNVARMDHIAPGEHSEFYAAQRFTLNLTRADMRRLGYSPSVRLFEAAACGAAILTDDWAGLDEFFIPEDEVLRVRCTADVQWALRECSDGERTALGARARERVLACHTADHRAATLEQYVGELLGARAYSAPAGPVSPHVRAGRERAPRLSVGGTTDDRRVEKDLTT